MNFRAAFVSNAGISLWLAIFHEFPLTHDEELAGFGKIGRGEWKDGGGNFGRMRHGGRILAGHGLGAHRRARGAGIDAVDA